MEKKKRYYPLPIRVTVWVLTVLLLCGGVALTALGGVGLALGEKATAQARIVKPYLDSYASKAAEFYAREGTVKKPPAPCSYVVTNERGEVLAATYDGGAYLASSSDTHHRKHDTDVTVTVYCPPADALTGNSPMEQAVRLVTVAVSGCRGYLIGGVLGLCLSVAGLVFLCCAVGRRRDGEVALRWVDRIPFDVFTLLWAVLCGLCGGLVRLPFGGALRVVLLFAAMLCLAVLLTSWLFSVAVRAKSGTLWRNTLIGGLWRALQRASAAAGRHLPVVWQVVGVLLAVSAIELLALLAFDLLTRRLLVLWLAEKVLLLPLLLWAALGLTRLHGGLRRMADGDITHQVSTRHLTGGLKAAAEDINRLGDGLQEAVEQQIKSERMKTELITNVSHDIKTPLTSIINYVDLMEKENPEDPTLQEYLAVLSRQSARLKKLVDDLLEASKASTGNLSVDCAPCRLNVLLEQVVGEYSERAQAADVTLCPAYPAETVTALADGRHLWRVLDNLLCNVCKYAQPHTRAYLDLTAEGNTAHIVLRNVSREALHISADELMERFVRGDDSRHTEGSGLGLAISRSLMELQGGGLNLTVDGDLFKVELTLPLAE